MSRRRNRYNQNRFFVRDLFLLANLRPQLVTLDLLQASNELSEHVVGPPADAAASQPSTSTVQSDIDTCFQSLILRSREKVRDTGSHSSMSGDMYRPPHRFTFRGHTAYQSSDGRMLQEPASPPHEILLVKLDLIHQFQEARDNCATTPGHLESPSPSRIKPEIAQCTTCGCWNVAATFLWQTMRRVFRRPALVVWHSRSSPSRICECTCLCIDGGVLERLPLDGPSRRRRARTKDKRAF